MGAILVPGVFGITVEDYLAVDGLQFRAKFQQHNRIRRLTEYQSFPFFLYHGDAVAIDPVDQSDRLCQYGSSRHVGKILMLLHHAVCHMPEIIGHTVGLQIIPANEQSSVVRI